MAHEVFLTNSIGRSYSETANHLETRNILHVSVFTIRKERYMKQENYISKNFTKSKVQ